MSQTIHDLRSHLFDTLRQLRDQDAPLDIDRAKAVADVARVIVDSAKVEVRALEVVGGRGTQFLQLDTPDHETVPTAQLPMRPLRGPHARGTAS